MQVYGGGENQVGEGGAQVVKCEEILALLPSLVCADDNMQAYHALAVIRMAHADRHMASVQLAQRIPHSIYTILQRLSGILFREQQLPISNQIIFYILLRIVFVRG